MHSDHQTYENNIPTHVRMLQAGSSAVNANGSVRVFVGKMALTIMFVLAPWMDTNYSWLKANGNCKGNFLTSKNGRGYILFLKQWLLRCTTSIFS